MNERNGEILNMKLKQQLKELLKQKDLKIVQVSRGSKVPLKTLHNWLSGQTPRDIRQVKKVADYFNVSMDYLCFGIEHMKNTEFEKYTDEINAGFFEVVLRRVK